MKTPVIVSAEDMEVLLVMAMQAAQDDEELADRLLGQLRKYRHVLRPRTRRIMHALSARFFLSKQAKGPKSHAAILKSMTNVLEAA